MQGNEPAAVLISGGSGFIGRRLAQQLVQQGMRVSILSRRAAPEPAQAADRSPAGPPADQAPSAAASPDAVRWIQGDLAQPETLPADLFKGVDLFFHCAGELKRPAAMHRLHVDGTAALIGLAAGRLRRWIQLSSVGAYGPPGAQRIDEQSPERPQGCYEQSKTISDQLVATAARAGAFQQVTLRPSIVYGPDMPNRSLYAMIGAIAGGRYFHIGRPGAVANYVHVDDVVAALLRCAERDEASGKTFIVSDHIDREALVAAVAQRLGRKRPCRRLPLPVAKLASSVGGVLPRFPLTHARIQALTTRGWYDSQRIQQTLDYRHGRSVQDGFLQLVDHWKLAS